MGKKIGRTAATGGRICGARGDVGMTRRRMPRAQKGHQRHELMAREAFGHDGTKEEFVKRSTRRPSKEDLSRNQGVGRKILWTRKGDVTRIAVSGSRSSETEAEPLSADVDGRRSTEDTALAGSECTRKAMEASTKNVNLEMIITQGWKESLSCMNILKKLGQSRVPRESKHRHREEEQ